MERENVSHTLISGHPQRVPALPAQQVVAVVMSLALGSDYVASTALEERAAHQTLYESFLENGGGDIAISSEPRGDRFLVHMIFGSCTGALGVLCAALSSCNIDIYRVSAYTTSDMIAVVTFQVSTFPADAKLALKQCLEKKIFDASSTGRESSVMDGELPGSYAHATTPSEREAHRRLYSAWCKSQRGVQLEWTRMAEGDSADVLLLLVFRDVEGSLAVITSALASCGINLRRVAAYCTRQSRVAIDSFQLDNFGEESEALLREQLTAHLFEIEG